MTGNRQLDNRGLEPPEPLLRTLRAAAALGAGDVLTVHSDRQPLFLLPRLEALGFRYRCRVQPDGSVQVEIRRADEALQQDPHTPERRD